MVGENYQIYTFQITGNAFVNECAEGILQIQSPVCGVIFRIIYYQPRLVSTRRKLNLNRRLEPRNH